MPHWLSRILKIKGISILVLIPFAVAGFYVVHSMFINTPIALKEPTFIVIDPGQGIRSISKELRNKGLIKSATLFEIHCRFLSGSKILKAGEYRFDGDITPGQIYTDLKLGKVYLHPILVVEGLTSSQIKETLHQKEVLQGPLDLDIPEGSLLPETYHVTRGQTRLQLVKRMHEDFQTFFNTTWARRQSDYPLKTQEQVIVLASLIEKETSKDEERARVASVYLNRIKKGMKLQSDPTILYGLYKKSGEFKKELSKSDLASDSVYNTYLYPGLPPTPICHAGKKSIEAALNPEKSDYMYFVADGTGGHVFSKTYKEHKKHHENWRKIRKLLKNAS